MDSPHFPDSRAWVQDSNSATGKEKASVVRPLAFVAVLAVCAYVDFAIQTTATKDQSSPEPGRASAMAAPDARYSPEARLAQVTAKYYIPAQSMHQAGSNYRRVAREAPDEFAPTPAEHHFPARPASQVGSNDGDVMTFGHD